MGRSNSGLEYALYYPTGRALTTVNQGREREPLFVDQEEVQTLSSRGSFLPHVIGRRRVGPVFAWVGDRQFFAPPGGRAGGKGGGGGGGGGGQLLIAENAWHLICVGPAKRLHRIWISGKIVFEGPIDADMMPSGSSVSVPDVGTFTIYWGETSQPLNPFLGDANRVGITSRWPYHCYVVWETFALGTQPNWPVVDYDIETEIVFTTLNQTDPSAETTPGPGVNPAHAISQTLFAPFPHGLEKDQSDFDMASLENVGLQLSNPSPGFVPDPINAELVANFDAADPSMITVDGDGFVSAWQDSFLSNVISPGGPASRRPIYFDGDNLPNGFATWPEIAGPINACPGVYFYADFLTYLESVGVIVPSQAYGFVSTITLYPARLDVGRYGVVNGFYDGAGPFAIGSSADVPEQPDNFTLQAGSEEQIGTDTINVFGHVVDENVGNVQATNGPTPFTPVTFVIGAIYTDLGGGNSQVELTVSTINAGTPVVSSGPITFPTSPNTFIMGGPFPTSPQGQYYLDGIVHQTILLRNNVLQSDIDLYVQWMRQRWASCGGSPDSRPYSMNALAQDGKLAGQLLAEIMRDASVAMRWNQVMGQFQFVALRANATVISVPDGYRTGDSTPQLDTLLLDVEPDKVVFSFVDVDHGFQKQTITVDDDGVADLASYAKSKEVNFPTVVDFDSAEAVSARRMMEELGLKVSIQFQLNHEGRIYYPGEVLSVPGVPYVVRVTELQLNKGSAVRIKAIPDIYGVEDFFYFQTPTGTGDETGQPIDPLPDALFGLFELPECLAPTADTMYAIVPRVRADAQQAFANVWLSPDDITYLNQGPEPFFQTGGTLDVAIDATSPYEGVVGAGAPTITVQGPDANTVPEDLSASLSLWRGGRQLVLINDEIFYLQALTAVGGLTYRLDGLIRARYDTERQSHAIGSEVYVLIVDQVTIVTEPLVLMPNVTAYAKTQPVASSALDLSLVTPDSRLLYGKGVRPAPPSGLRVDPAWSFSYVTGDDVTLVWSHRTCATGTGAGVPGAGVPHATPALVGDFILEVYDAGLVLQDTKNLGQTPTYTFLNAEILSLFGAETDFTVRVYVLRLGQLSAPIEQLIEFLP